MPRPQTSLPLSPADASIDELMESATAALTEMRYFDAERIAGEALAKARRAERFDTMARIVLPLQEARRQRLDRAFDAVERSPRFAGRPLIVGPQTEAAGLESSSALLESGAWLVQPPMVGADARRLRCAALQAHVPVAVLCREPTTRKGGCPLVAVGATVFRAIVEPPPDAESPETAWFIRGMEALGDAAIAACSRERDPIRLIDALVDALDAHPDHEKLHQSLEAACRAAAAITRGRPRRASKDPSLDPSQSDPRARSSPRR